MGKKDFSTEDSLRHLRCRGMTSRGFSLAMLILAFARWHDEKKKILAGEEMNRIDEFSERGQTDKFPLKNGDLFT